MKTVWTHVGSRAAMVAQVGRGLAADPATPVDPKVERRPGACALLAEGGCIVSRAASCARGAPQGSRLRACPLDCR